MRSSVYTCERQEDEHRLSVWEMPSGLYKPKQQCFPVVVGLLHRMIKMDIVALGQEKNKTFMSVHIHTYICIIYVYVCVERGRENWPSTATTPQWMPTCHASRAHMAAVGGQVVQQVTDLCASPQSAPRAGSCRPSAARQTGADPAHDGSPREPPETRQHARVE